jgi:hypothetical protein
LNTPIRILLQTTIPAIEDDWNINRFKLLREHLGSLTDDVTNQDTLATIRRQHLSRGPTTTPAATVIIRRSRPWRQYMNCCTTPVRLPALSSISPPIHTKALSVCPQAKNTLA